MGTPLLAYRDWIACVGNPNDEREVRTAEAVRDFYEAKITSGKLKIVNKVEVHHPSVPEEVWMEWYKDPMRLRDDSFGILVTKCCSQNPYFNSNRRESYFGVPPLTWACPGCGLTVKLHDEDE